MRSGLPFTNRARQKTVVSDGFTIVESLIFLAVSSALLISVLAVFSGSQNKTQFSQALDDVNQRIDTVVNNVANGYYPRRSQITTCTIPDTEGTPVAVTYDDDAVEAESGRGTNQDCVFIGRIMQFVKGSDVIRVYDVVGARQETVGGITREASTLKAVRPTLLRDVETIQIKNGLSIQTLGLETGASDYGGFAIFTSFGEYSDSGDGSGTRLQSGSLTTNFSLIESLSLDLGGDEEALAEEVQDKLTGFTDTYESVINPTEGILLCFESGTTKQFGRIQIGGRGLSATTTQNISTTPCLEDD